MAMVKLNPARLRGVRTFDDVVKYLAEELDWPMAVSELEDAVFDWDPSELGIPAERVPQLVSLRELRPLEARQPWGIFFLEFSGPRLPLTALRRLLDKLVTKKRASHGGERRTWKLNDLLFIITTSNGEAVELHFVTFFDQPGHAAEIRSLPWRPAQSPARHLKRLATELLPNLAWPSNAEDRDEWLTQWRGAFKLRHGEAISSAIKLAERMADTAKGLRSEIAEALAAEKSNGPFSTLMADVRDQLFGGVTPDTFADMCAQTLVYGVLTSRITDPISFGASPALTSIPLSNPFLAAFFEDVHDQASGLDLEGIGLEQLVADLRESNVEAILDQFGSSAKGGDPVIHFYEEFLQRYDRKMRADAGAFYTPQPVVEFMTRTVDNILRERFGLAAGLADSGTWAEVAARNEFVVPNGVEPEARFVSMIDPATGTGTFLVEWLRTAKSSFLQTRPVADWPDHVRDVVLPSMHAFELMLGPYAIAHLKVALELHDQGVLDDAATVLLTDTLDHESHNHLLFGDDPVSAEGERAAALKDGARFTVCIGNPPYDREQKDLGATGKRKGGIARYGVPGIAPLMDAVLDPLKAAGLGKHAKNAYNDYVYFWCWAIWQAVTKRKGPGVVAFITASSYLDGVSLGGLRSHMRDVFDELWVVDLGGEGRGARTDENVFAIRTPVAIAFGIRNGHPGKGCVVRYLAIEGTREEKLTQLSKLNLLVSPAEPISGKGLERLTPTSSADYHDWPEITEIFPCIFPGVKAGRTWVIGPSKSVISRRMAKLLDHPARGRAKLFKDSPTGRKCAESLGRTIMPGKWDLTSVARLVHEPPTVRYGYRSFDRQWVVADPRFLDRASAAWSLDGAKQVFLTTLTSTKLGSGPAVTATPYIPDLDNFRGSYGAKNVMPLYRDRRGTSPNLAAGMLNSLGQQLAREVSAEDLVAYVFGLTATGAFAERFADELGEGAGPVRIPITTDPKLFTEVSKLGVDLLWWHTWGERFGGGAELPSGGAKELLPVVSYPEKFWWDSDSETLHIGDGEVGPVPAAVWNFDVSGLKALQSWLGNRMKEGKGRKSSPLDDIRPERWTFTPELLTLISILEHTVAQTPKAAALLDRVVNSQLIDAGLLPTPTDGERKAPKG